MEWDIGLQKNPDQDLEVDQIQTQIKPKLKLNLEDQNLEEEIKMEELQEVDLLQGDKLQGDKLQVDKLQEVVLLQKAKNKDKKLFKNNNNQIL
jgi:hypothetical protein